MVSRRSRANNSSPRARQSAARLTRNNSRLISVRVPLPVTLRVRKVSYTYPLQRSRARRTIPVAIRPLRNTRYVTRSVSVRIPNRLPHIPASYVSVRRGALRIHSARQTRKILDREFNRRRYMEWKRRRRQAKDGQLESVRRDRHGILGAAEARGYSASRMAEAALIVRALGG